MQRSPFLRSLFIAATICSTPCLSHAQAEKQESLKSLVSEWVKVMQKLGDEESRWRRDEQILKDSASSLEIEIAELEEKIASAKDEISKVDTASKEDLKKKEGYENARNVLAEQLPQMEKNLIGLKNIVPTFALTENAKLRTAFEAIETSNKENKKNALNGRLADIVNALTELEKLQQTVSVREDFLKLNEEEKKVTVVYFGLATAYAANQSGSVAAIGTPSPQGWDFEQKPELAEQIVRLIQVANGEGQVDFSTLPISIN